MDIITTSLQSTLLALRSYIIPVVVIIVKSVKQPELTSSVELHICSTSLSETRNFIAPIKFDESIVLMGNAGFYFYVKCCWWQHSRVTFTEWEILSASDISDTTCLRIANWRLTSQKFLLTRLLLLVFFLYPNNKMRMLVFTWYVCIAYCCFF